MAEFDDQHHNTPSTSLGADTTPTSRPRQTSLLGSTPRTDSFEERLRSINQKKKSSFDDFTLNITQERILAAKVSTVLCTGSLSKYIYCRLLHLTPWQLLRFLEYLPEEACRPVGSAKIPRRTGRLYPSRFLSQEVLHRAPQVLRHRRDWTRLWLVHSAGASSQFLRMAFFQSSRKTGAPCSASSKGKTPVSAHTTSSSAAPVRLAAPPTAPVIAYPPNFSVPPPNFPATPSSLYASSTTPESQTSPILSAPPPPPQLPPAVEVTFWQAIVPISSNTVSAYRSRHRTERGPV